MYLYIKTISDFIVSFIMFLVLLPIMIFVGLMLFISLQGTPFFLQKRPGKNGKIFKVIKFRTMNNKVDAKGELLHDDLRLTKIGKLVRKLSLDELPQLINVFKGDMSLIGPRPLLPEYLPYYNDYQKRRHDVKPGITGWAQVNGRNEISWEKKFELDVWYVDHISAILDIKIVLLTIKKVLKPEGINFVDTGIDQRFRGTN